MKAIMYTIGIIIIIIIIVVLNYYNNKDSAESQRKRHVEDYYVSLLEKGYEDVDILIEKLPLDRSKGPNLIIGPNADFEFAFDSVVTIYDRNGILLGQAGPGMTLDIGKKIEYEKLYVLSETSWKDNIYIRHN